MTNLAIVLYEGSPGSRELRLERILDFFGVPWKEVEASELRDTDKCCLDCVVFGSIRAVAATLKQRQEITPLALRPAAFYAYADEDRSHCLRTIQSLFGDANLSFREAPAGALLLSVSNGMADLVGPMAGLKILLQLRSEDAILNCAPAGGDSRLVTIISAEDAGVFVRFERDGAPIYFCTSPQIVDIDQRVVRGFYDVKDHFCSVVPLIMFMRYMFPDVAWRPQELGACLVIDDPLLKSQYGFCNFKKLRDLMRGHGFTTNIAFIPWNWRRTSPSASKFFRDESGFFSISIHGCDHTAGEFGMTSLEVLHSRAQLARSRMQSHEARTGIQYDPIMVFPQGVFSSACPEILKCNGFIAAVNTEIMPVDTENAETRIKHVWDVAIMAYGDFPIFTRRYTFHGLENFAFDLLLGKPCLIVAHHDVFKDGGVELIKLIEKIGSLNCSLRWRPLGEVIRRACRRRTIGDSAVQVEMYGNELIIGNPSAQTVEVKIRKKIRQDELISEILCDGHPVRWEKEVDHLSISERVRSHNERSFRVIYQGQPHTGAVHRSFRYEVSVAARRILSEFRDDILDRNRFLSASGARLKRVLKKHN